MMDGWRIEQDSGAAYATVITSGALLDNNNAHQLVDLLTNEHANGTKFIILNLKTLEFLSSAGVGAILGTVALFREREGDIVLCNLSKTIHHILSVLDLTEFLTIKSSSADAQELCAAGKA